jgi:hypothetical protein
MSAVRVCGRRTFSKVTKNHRPKTANTVHDAGVNYMYSLNVRVQQELHLLSSASIAGDERGYFVFVEFIPL